MGWDGGAAEGNLHLSLLSSPLPPDPFPWGRTLTDTGPFLVVPVMDCTLSSPGMGGCISSGLSSGCQGSGSLLYVCLSHDDSDGSCSKESACNMGDLGTILGLGRFSWRREQLPTPVFLPGECHGQRSLVGKSLPHVLANAKKQGIFFFCGRTGC